MEKTNAVRRSPFARAFYVANVMEIFERFAWYGFFAVSSVYLTTPASQGGLGFSEQQRGIVQGLVPFFLYLLPVITGALGDRFGYRRMFIASFVVMTPSYYLLGQVHSFWSFMFVFFAVAIGAAMFKPLVVATVSRTTDDTNRGLGFGIFYMMVNLGGFLGPIVAGYFRAISWDLVFILAAAWIAANFIPAIFFFRDPPSGEEDSSNKSIGQVLREAQEVLGNGRFALTVFPLLILLMVAGGGWMTWTAVGITAAIWIVVNLAWNTLVKDRDDAPWYGRRTRVGNAPFVVYLLVIGGFWALCCQVFYTFPIYMRDYVDTSDVVQGLNNVHPSLGASVSSVNAEALATELDKIIAQPFDDSEQKAQAIRGELVHLKVRVPAEEIAGALPAIASGETTALSVAKRWAADYGQVAPEYILAVIPLCILIFQLLISRMVERRRVFMVLVSGTLIVGASYLLVGLAPSLAIGGIVLVGAMLAFAFGEMLASPKSQDYVAGIMPKAKAAMFMGYYFVSMAIGFLFGGILSGWAYEQFCVQWQRPGLMWVMFAGLAAATAIALAVFDRTMARQLEQNKSSAPVQGTPLPQGAES